MHIAIGESYPGCYVEDEESEAGKKQLEKFRKQSVLNTSAQHVDIVIDFRDGGAGRHAYLDDTEIISKDNIWVIPE